MSVNGFWCSRNRIVVLVAILLASMGADSTVVADKTRDYHSEKHAFKLVPVGGPLDQAWGMAFLPDGRFLITEKDGKLRILDRGGRLSGPLPGLPEIEAYGQGGLLDVALHPDFSSNGRIYLSLAWDVRGGKTTAVGTAQLVDDRVQGFKIIFTAQPGDNSGRHFGSRLRFGHDGKLFVTIGDRGNRPSAQNLGTHAGKILRLNQDGSAPDDNPFVDLEGAFPEIWSYGHRNPQGLAFETRTGRLWSQEHGPRGGDEVNLVERGGNYGWPIITHGRNYFGTKITDETKRPGMEQPKTYWVPSIAPSGLTVYHGDKFPRWNGNLFVGALKAQVLVRLEMDDDNVIHEERLLSDFNSRIRDVRTGPDGLIYLLLDEDDASLWRLEPQ